MVSNTGHSGYLKGEAGGVRPTTNHAVPHTTPSQGGQATPYCSTATAATAPPASNRPQALYTPPPRPQYSITTNHVNTKPSRNPVDAISCTAAPAKVHPRILQPHGKTCLQLSMHETATGTVGTTTKPELAGIAFAQSQPSSNIGVCLCTMKTYLDQQLMAQQAELVNSVTNMSCKCARR